MATERRELQTQPEGQPVRRMERTRTRRVFTPKVDILETGDAVQVTADMPGVDEQSVHVTLEKNVLTLEGTVDWKEPGSHELLYSEYEVGDFYRAFTLSEAVDQNRIEAKVRNGVLTLTLPKAEPAKARQIQVQAG